MRCVSRRNATQKGLGRAAASSVLAEWGLEHADRGYRKLSEQDCPERFRAVLLAAKKPQRRRMSVSRPKQRYVNHHDSIARRALGRRRTAAQHLESRQRLSRQWDALSDGASTKVRWQEDFERGLQDQRLERAMAPRDGVRGGEHSPPGPVDVRSLQPGSLHALGSPATPLAGPELERWRCAQPHRGLRTAPRAGLMSKITRDCAQPRPERELAQDVGHCTCQHQFVNGVCRSKEELHLEDAELMRRELWLWSTSRWRSPAKEGQMLARIRMWDAQERCHCSYAFLSRRFGNPRRTIWTLVQATHTRPEPPCELRVALDDRCLVHQADMELCLRARRNATRIAVEEMVYEDASMMSLAAAGVADGSSWALWPLDRRKGGVKGGGRLQELARAERQVNKRDPKKPPKRAAGRASGPPRSKRRARGRGGLEADPEVLHEQARSAHEGSGSDPSVAGASSDPGSEEEAPGAQPAAGRRRGSGSGSVPGQDAAERSSRGAVRPPRPAGAARAPEARGSAEARPSQAAAARDARAAHREAVFVIVQELRRNPDFAHTDRRAVLGMALDRMEALGQRFWGANLDYGRRRTAVDACLAQCPTDLP